MKISLFNSRAFLAIQIFASLFVVTSSAKADYLSERYLYNQCGTEFCYFKNMPHYSQIAWDIPSELQVVRGIGSYLCAPTVTAMNIDMYRANGDVGLKDNSLVDQYFTDKHIYKETIPSLTYYMDINLKSGGYMNPYYTALLKSFDARTWTTGVDSSSFLYQGGWEFARRMRDDKGSLTLHTIKYAKHYKWVGGVLTEYYDANATSGGHVQNMNGYYRDYLWINDPNDLFVFGGAYKWRRPVAQYPYTKYWVLKYWWFGWKEKWIPYYRWEPPKDGLPIFNASIFGDHWLSYITTSFVMKND